VGVSGQGVYQLLVTKSHTIFEMYVDEAAAMCSFGRLGPFGSRCAVA